MANQESQGSGCLKLILAVILGFICLSFIGYCFAAMDSGRPNVSSGGDSRTSSAGQNAPVVKTVEWSFSEKTDDFDGKVTKFCIIESNDYIKAAIGREKVMIQVRQKNNKNMDILVVTDGVVFGNMGDSNKVRLKFDDEQPFSVGYNESANGSASVIFLRSTSKIIDKLKKSKKLVIELPVFMESRQRASFDIAGYNEVCTF